MNKVFCIPFFIVSSKFGVYFMLTAYANSEKSHLKVFGSFLRPVSTVWDSTILYVLSHLRFSLVSVIKMFTLDNQEKLAMHHESTQ